MYLTSLKGVHFAYDLEGIVKLTPDIVTRSGMLGQNSSY